MKQKHIAILDFGSQYMHLISRRIRQLGVLAKIYPTDVNAHDLKDAWGIVISGGPQSVNNQSLHYDPGIFDLDIPILGLCYGHQLLAHHYGGVVTEAHNREYGLSTLQVSDDSGLFESLHGAEQVWMSHWDSVTTVPKGFTVIGTTTDCPVAAMANPATHRYGLQFHPEVHHTTNGMKILKNFVFDICKAEKNWSMNEYMSELTKELKDLVAHKKVFLLVSGGVDSSVAFAFLKKVLGEDRVFGLHIDNGFMRKDESVLVKKELFKAGFSDLHVIDASDRFVLAVEQLTDPEQKRRKVGNIFLDVQKDVFKDLNFNQDEWLLGQGTIYPDTIESGGTDASDVIKTHHNRIPEIIEMIHEGRVVEPLSNLYKDEVRELGLQLGLPEHMVKRWPFPGPGLSIRCLCSDGVEEEMQDAEKINEQIQTLAHESGCEGIVLPVRSVGVQGDLRSYQHPAMLYNAGQLSWDELNELSVKITNALPGVNRVVVDIGPTSGQHALKPKKMKLVEARMTRKRLDVLREADAIVDAVIRKSGLYDDIWQFPVILIPVTFGRGGESIVLRPIESLEAMTVNFYAMDKKVLKKITNKILKLDGVDALFYDITHKPPATIEWE